MCNLGGLYMDQGKLAQAEPLLVRALEIARRTRGQTHPDTLTMATKLAVLYWRDRKFDLSGPLFEDVLKGRRDKLGPDHPDTLTAMANLGGNHRDAGRLQEGLALLEQAWALARKRPDPLAKPLEWIPGALAKTYDQAGRFADAEPLYRETLESERRQYGEASAQVGQALVKLADTLFMQRKYAEAESLHREALATCRKAHVEASPLAAAAMAKLGSDLLKQQKYAEAEPFVRECLRIRERIEPGDWRTFNARSLLGGSLLGQEKYAEAEPMLKAGYEGMKRREATIPPAGKIHLTEGHRAVGGALRSDRRAREGRRVEGPAGPGRPARRRLRPALIGPAVSRVPRRHSLDR